MHPAGSRLADVVAGRIRDLVVAHDLGEGDRLPSERALAELTGASRPTVSQALRTLSLSGLVEVRRGSGAYVVRRPDRAGPSPVRLTLDVDDSSMGQLLDLRLWLETLGVRQAVQARTGGAGVRTALDRLLAGVGDTSSWIAADTVFHATLVGASGNRYLQSVYESVHTAVIAHEYEPWVRDDTVPPWLHRERAHVQLDLHAPIVEAVERGDVASAVLAVHRHHDAMLEHLATGYG